MSKGCTSSEMMNIRSVCHVRIKDIQPARIAQLLRALDFKTQGCGFYSRAGQLNNYQLPFG